MQKIIPHLWFDSRAEEAARFYASIFNDAEITNLTRYGKAGAEVSGMPEGTVMTVGFRLEGQDFVALNGGPAFTFSPAVSFFVNCGSREEVDTLWEKLSEDGAILMPLSKYPFSERFGWFEDKFGLSWQVNLAPREQKITPFLMFVGDKHGKAEEAVTFYTSLFENSAIENIERWSENDDEQVGTVKHALFLLERQEFMAMDSGKEHHFTFTPAISFLVNCETQKEVDTFWRYFTEGGGEPSQCGWVTDKYGISWQVVPTILGKLMQDKDAARSERVMQAMLTMQKLDIADLQKAYENIV